MATLVDPAIKLQHAIGSTQVPMTNEQLDSAADIALAAIQR